MTEYPNTGLIVAYPHSAPDVIPISRVKTIQHMVRPVYEPIRYSTYYHDSAPIRPAAPRIERYMRVELSDDTPINYDRYLGRAAVEQLRRELKIELRAEIEAEMLRERQGNVFEFSRTRELQLY